MENKHQSRTTAAAPPSAHLPPVWCLPVALGWVILWQAGFPAPHVDDLFFSGPGASIAAGEGLRNPWIEPWLSQFGSNAYFAQLPLHPYLLGGWLKIWGLSTASLLAFQCLAGWLACIFCAALLRKSGCPPWVVAAGCLAAAAFVLDKGLRTEPWAAVFSLAAAWAWWRPGRVGWTLGVLAAVAGVVIHPFVIVVVLPAAAIALFIRWRQAGRHEAFLCLAILAGVALAMLGLVVVLLDFRVAEFWDTFRSHARLRTPPGGRRFASFWENATLGREPYLKGPALLALAVAMVFGWRWGSRQRVALAAAVLLGGLILGIFLYAGHTPIWLWPVSVFFSLTIWSTVMLPRAQIVGSMLSVAALLWGILPQALKLAIVRPEPPEHYAAIRAEIERLLPTHLLVDETTARFVYDFDLPKGARDWLLTRQTGSGMISSLAAKPKGEVWSVDARKLVLYVPDAGIKPTPASFIGISVGNWIAHPYKLHVLP